MDVAVSQHLGLTNSEMLYVFEEFTGSTAKGIAKKRKEAYRRGQIEMTGMKLPRQPTRSPGPPIHPEENLETQIRDSRTSRYVVSVGGRRHSSITEVDGRDFGLERTSGKWFGPETDVEEDPEKEEKDMDVESIVEVKRPNGSEMQGSIAMPSPSASAWAMRMH